MSEEAKLKGALAQHLERAPQGLDAWTLQAVTFLHVHAADAQARLAAMELEAGRVRLAIVAAKGDMDTIINLLNTIQARLDDFDGRLPVLDEVEGAVNAGKRVADWARWAATHWRVLAVVGVFVWASWGRSLSEIQERAARALAGWNAAQQVLGH